MPAPRFPPPWSVEELAPALSSATRAPTFRATAARLGAVMELGLRRAQILFGVVVYLAAAGCTALPEKFKRIDGRFEENQLLNDQAICRAEIKDNLSAANQTTTWGGPTDDAVAVYTGCMARHGYKAE